MRETAGTALIFSGPHGAGKDTLEHCFRQFQPASTRIVRHITRPMAPGEVDGQDYYFVDETTFKTMAGHGIFLEHSTYPDCMSGTSEEEIRQKVQQAPFANVVANVEEGLTLHRLLGVVGIRSVCLFISPVPQVTFRHQPDAYIAALRERMQRRGRPADRISNKLAKAMLYRELYLQNESDAYYIDNSEGRIHQAVRDIERSVVTIGGSLELSGERVNL